MLAIMVEEVLEQRLEPLRREGAPLHGEAPLQQGTASLPDEVASRSERDRVEAFALQDEIQGRDEIGGGVRKRSVEIEDDDRKRRRDGHGSGDSFPFSRSHAACPRASVALEKGKVGLLG